LCKKAQSSSGNPAAYFPSCTRVSRVSGMDFQWQSSIGALTRAGQSPTKSSSYASVSSRDPVRAVFGGLPGGHYRIVASGNFQQRSNSTPAALQQHSSSTPAALQQHSSSTPAVIRARFYTSSMKPPVDNLTVSTRAFWPVMISWSLPLQADSAISGTPAPTYSRRTSLVSGPIQKDYLSEDSRR
jgi:hypothetical protein